MFFHLSLLLLFLDPGSGIRDPGSGMGKNQDPGSGIRDPGYTSPIRNTGSRPHGLWRPGKRAPNSTLMTKGNLVINLKVPKCEILMSWILMIFLS